MTVLTLTPGAVTLADLARVYFDEAPVRLDRAAKPAVDRAAAAIRAAAEGAVPVYGVNTG
ncbi:MAG: aromatic amino acid lyase, partial [Proteobacteria bacterium]|nr:aromatic amino acid lyase [Pseudomonadota bacterium]